MYFSYYTQFVYFKIFIYFMVLRILCMYISITFDNEYFPSFFRDKWYYLLTYRFRDSV